MNDEAREALRERNRARANCSRCGSAQVERITGLDDEAHFPSVTYKRCRACGHEVAMKGRR